MKSRLKRAFIFRAVDRDYDDETFSSADKDAPGY
jgi:hypothetical protein